MAESMTKKNNNKTAIKIIYEVCEDICDNFCKYRETINEDCECVMCDKCPLDRLQ